MPFFRRAAKRLLGKTTAAPGLAQSRLVATLKDFGANRGGNVIVIFGITSMAIFVSAGAGLDLSNAYFARQKLAQVAIMACQYATRPAIIDTATASYSGANGGSTYVSSVNSFITNTLSSQNFKFTQTNGSPFTYTQNGPANVQLTSTVPTNFMPLIKVNTIPITATMHCYDTPSSIPQRVPTGTAAIIVNESFEAGGVSGGWKSYLPNGTQGTQSSASGFSSTTSYTGSGGNSWRATGYCLEQDSAGLIKSAVFDGNFSVELDCDNGSGSKGNSSISTQVYLPAGNYELRYAYSSRVFYPNYTPAYLCGSSAADLSWANDTNSSGGPVSNALRTNQINVYLDLNTNGAPPMHTTLDGATTLAGGNLIDMCVYSWNWVQRSVKITVTTPGYYWLSFAADGQNDSYGGQLDNILLCTKTCTTSLQDNFPSAWLSSSNPLFEDTFETMSLKVYLGQWGIVDMTTSYGTSGTSNSGWPNTTASGWAIDPVNEGNAIYYQAAQGSTAIELDADPNVGGVTTSNRTISRPFLLMPGYYQVSYYYRADVLFASLGTTVYCGSTPSNAMLSSLSGSAVSTYAYYNGFGVTSYPKDTNIVAMFMSHAQLASNPSMASYGNTPTYSNPDGSTTNSPAVQNDSISLTNYDSTQVNPLLDICGYAATWQNRTAYIKISKPAYYWLTMAALGTADKVGGAIDDVRLWALGSPYMSSPPAGAVTIPVPSPQPGATSSFTGFYITADPFQP